MEVAIEYGNEEEQTKKMFIKSRRCRGVCRVWLDGGWLRKEKGGRGGQEQGRLCVT